MLWLTRSGFKRVAGRKPGIRENTDDRKLMMALHSGSAVPWLAQATSCAPSCAPPTRRTRGRCLMLAGICSTSAEWTLEGRAQLEEGERAGRLFTGRLAGGTRR